MSMRLFKRVSGRWGNDHRLGANEAPPAIISVFLGDQLTDVMNQLITTGMANHSIGMEKLETGVKAIPEFMRDNGWKQNLTIYRK